MDSGGPLLLKNNILLSELLDRSSHSQVLKNLLNGGELYEICILGIGRDMCSWNLKKKILGLVLEAVVQRCSVKKVFLEIS